MGFLGNFRKTPYERIIGTPLERLKLNDLMKEKMRIQNHIALVEKGLKKFEKQETDLFKQGVGADLFKKKFLARQLIQLEFQFKMKYSVFMTMNKQLIFMVLLQF